MIHNMHIITLSARRHYDSIIIIIIVFTYETDLTRSPHAIHE